MMLMGSRGLATIVTLVTFVSGNRARRGRASVTCVTVGVTRLVAQYPFPGGAERGPRRARTKPVGALATHAHRRGRERDVAGAVERAEEADLAVLGPAVVARAGNRCLVPFWFIHRQA